MVDALGNPTAFFLIGGQAHDLVGADQLHPVPHVQADTVIADNRVLEPLAAAGKTTVIRPKPIANLPRV